MALRLMDVILSKESIDCLELYEYLLSVLTIIKGGFDGIGAICLQAIKVRLCLVSGGCFFTDGIIFVVQRDFRALVFGVLLENSRLKLSIFGLISHCQSSV